MKVNDEVGGQPGPIRVMLANDQPVMMQGMRLALAEITDVAIVGEVGCPDVLHATLMSTPCDVLLVDLVMPQGRALDGLTMLDAIRTTHPQVRVVVVLSGDSAVLVSQLLAMGAVGVLSRRDAPASFEHAIRHAHAFRLYLSREVCAGGSSQMPAAQGLNLLTWREIEVLRLQAVGLSLTEIANRTGKSVQTVSAQKVKALRKLGLASNGALYRYASAVGLGGEAFRTTSE